MYGLPSDFDPAILCGRTLESVCYAAYQVTLHFGADLSITVHGPLYYRPPSRPATELMPPFFLAGIESAVGGKITSAAVHGTGSLALALDNSHELTCQDRPGYESYVIFAGGKEIVV